MSLIDQPLIFPEILILVCIFRFNMKKILFSILLISTCLLSKAQYETIFHPSSFKKFKGAMRSNGYKPDKDENLLLDASSRAIFPSDVKKNTSHYLDSLVHWIGIVTDVVIIDSSNISNIVFTMDHKYWDYIEDYSIQDEVMFLSPLGEGEFHMLVQLELTPDQKEKLKNMPQEKTLFLCYGKVIEDTSLPALKASYIKTVDYKYYSTKIFSYTIKRDKEGLVVTDKSGKPQTDEFKFLKVARRGQNKD